MKRKNSNNPSSAKSHSKKRKLHNLHTLLRNRQAGIQHNKSIDNVTLLKAICRMTNSPRKNQMLDELIRNNSISELINIKDINGNNALIIAAKLGDKAVVKTHNIWAANKLLC